MAIALSVCTCSEQQLHPEPQSQAISVGPFWSVGNKQWGCLLWKKAMGGRCDRERSLQIRISLVPVLSRVSPGARLCTAPSTATTWVSAGAPRQSTVLKKQKGSGQRSENSAITAPRMWRNYEMCFLPKQLFCVLWNKQDGRKCWIRDIVLGETPSHPQIASNTNSNTAQTRICGKSESLEMTYLYSTPQHCIMASLLSWYPVLEVLLHSRPWGCTRSSSSA